MSNDQKLEELLDLWEDAAEQGQELNPSELCRDTPELLEPLKTQIAALKKMNGCFDAYQAEPTNDEPKKQSNSSIEFDSKLINLQFHDRGGLGEVFKAHDHELHRDVAVKFLHEKIARNEVDRNRFQQEAEITGRLDHPGVVPVYANGKTDQDQPFYVMRFIRGDTLDDAIKHFHKFKFEFSPSEKRVALRKLLSQLISVCQTIGYAHTRGIIHRDIKPKNIMLGKYGETLVVDWGLAIPFSREGQFRVKDEKTLVPQSIKESDSGREGEGTPVFMSPEQAAGKDDLGPASDIYSLGTVLFRAITGKFPFDGKTPADIKVAIMKGEFKTPRSFDATIPKSLEAICVKAMQTDIKQRYQTATEMAEDLENFLADAPVSSYQYSTTERFGRFVSRYQSLFTTLLLAAMLLTGVFMFASTRLYRMQRDANHSLTAAINSQVESLNMTCLMTARSIQYNLEARLIAMEELASSPEFIELVQSPESAKDNSKLLQLLQNNRDALQQRLPSVAWFVLNEQGKLICRVSDDTPQKLEEANWDWRQPYFHGGEIELPKDSSFVPPIAKPSLSPVFFGRYQDRELCSLSVPVMDGKDKQATVAVLVMAIRMGQFDPLIEADTDSHGQRFASLIETRGELRGSLLHHPGIVGMSSSEIKNVQVCESVLESLLRIPCEQTSPSEVKDYIDPLGARYAGEWNSVAIPIQIRSRDNTIVSCGWYLMVQDRPFAVR